MENDLRNQPGAVAALEANFVPVKINYDYYPNTAKQYGVTRLPTTVILAPNARGEVLAVIPEYMPVGQYLSTLNKVAADAKRRQAGVFAQIPGQPAGRISGRDRTTAGHRTCGSRQFGPGDSSRRCAATTCRAGTESAAGRTARHR